MDKITLEQLQEIEDFAYKYLSKKEICIILKIDEAIFEEDDSQAELSFITGRLKRKAQFNLNIIQLSDQLSSPAQAIEAKMA